MQPVGPVQLAVVSQQNRLALRNPKGLRHRREQGALPERGASRHLAKLNPRHI